MLWLYRRLLELLRISPIIAIPEEEFEAFFRSRCWLALRQEIGARLDHHLGVMAAPDTSERMIFEARGALGALEWLLDAEDVIRNHIMKHEDELSETAEREENLRNLLAAIEREVLYERRKHSHGRGDHGFHS